MFRTKLAVLIAVFGLAACVPSTAPVSYAAASDAQTSKTTSAEDYAAYCSACHGAGAKGDGGMAGELAKKPADLTRLSARNGGAFPTTRVMAQIWGYAGAKARGIMPDFGPLMGGETVLYDGGDGIDTPTPARLVGLAEYLKSLQVK